MSFLDPFPKRQEYGLVRILGRPDSEHCARLVDRHGRSLFGGITPLPFLIEKVSDSTVPSGRKRYAAPASHFKHNPLAIEQHKITVIPDPHPGFR
jgi:hypothetical protein